jgi:hypothetical protein
VGTAFSGALHPAPVVRLPCRRCKTPTRIDRMVQGYGRHCAERLGLIGKTTDTGQTGPDLFDTAKEIHMDDASTPATPESGRWRVGRHLGRTLYIDDQVVGMVDTVELAAAIVDAMNGAGDAEPLVVDDAELVEGIADTIQRVYGDATRTVLDHRAAVEIWKYLQVRGVVSENVLAAVIEAAGGKITVPNSALPGPPAEVFVVGDRTNDTTTLKARRWGEPSPGETP